MNILLLSVGTRNKIVEYFKKELCGKGLVIATDADMYAPALYVADEYYVVPKITDKTYLDVIIEICRKNDVKAVMSFIDPELSIIALNRDRFIEVGSIPIISSYEIVEMCFDKRLTLNRIKELDLNCIKTYSNIKDIKLALDKKEIKFPLIAKPFKGSASLDIHLVNNISEIKQLLKNDSKYILQEYIYGIEYGADAFVDIISGEVVSIFIKKKIKMRAGETDKSISLHNFELENLIKYFVTSIGFRGVLDIDIFEREGEFYISEVNPRFGGGYPHAFECGVNFPKYIINNVLGRINHSLKVSEYEDNIIMMKYNDVIIRKSHEE